MTRLANRLTVWGPCVWGAAIGGLVDYYNGFWGPCLVSGAVLGFLVGRQRLAAQLRDRELRARATDGLEGRIPPEDFEDWEIEDDLIEDRRPRD